jgi:hypothetical protein
MAAKSTDQNSGGHFESQSTLAGDADRLEAAFVEFAYLHDHEMPDGSHRIVTVPVN